MDKVNKEEAVLVGKGLGFRKAGKYSSGRQRKNLCFIDKDSKAA